MPTHDAVDPSVEEADRRAERAKESLLSRVELLKERLAEARHRFDPTEQIARHPLPAVGLAFALGVISGLGSGRQAHGEAPRSSLMGAALAGLAAVTLRIVRELAMAQLGNAAHDWWTARGGASSSEAHRSGTPDVEPFLEH